MNELNITGPGARDIAVPWEIEGAPAGEVQR